MSEEQAKKSVTFYTRINEIQEQYGRPPTSYELRALQELPLSKNNLWDSTPTGQKIHQLLLDSKNGTKVSYLEEAGRLLWLQMSQDSPNLTHSLNNISALEELEKQYGLPDQSYSSSSLTNDPFGKAVKRKFVESARMEDQIPTFEGSSRAQPGPNDPHPISYPDLLVSPPNRQLMQSPSPTLRLLGNAASQMAMAKRPQRPGATKSRVVSRSAAPTQSTTLGTSASSYHHYDFPMSNPQDPGAYTDSQVSSASLARQQPMFFPYQPSTISQQSSEHRTKQQLQGPGPQNPHQIPLHSDPLYNNPIPVMNCGGYYDPSHVSSVLMSPQATPQYSLYHGTPQEVVNSGYQTTLPNLTNPGALSTETFDCQWNSSFNQNQPPQQYAVPNLYMGLGQQSYANHGVYPPNLDGPIPFHPEVYSQHLNYSTSQWYQYDMMHQQAHQLNHNPQPQATPKSILPTTPNRENRFDIIAGENSTEKRRPRFQLQSSYPAYPFDNKRLDPPQLQSPYPFYSLGNKNLVSPHSLSLQHCSPSDNKNLGLANLEKPCLSYPFGSQPLNLNAPRLQAPQPSSPLDNLLWEQPQIAKKAHKPCQITESIRTDPGNNPMAQDSYIDIKGPVKSVAPMPLQPFQSNPRATELATPTKSKETLSTLKNSASSAKITKETTSARSQMSSIATPPVAIYTGALGLMKRIKLPLSNEWITVSADYKGPGSSTAIAEDALVKTKPLRSKEMESTLTTELPPSPTPSGFPNVSSNNKAKRTKDGMSQKVISIKKETTTAKIKRSDSASPSEDSSGSLYVPEVNPHKPLSNKRKIEEVRGEDEDVVKEPAKKRGRGRPVKYRV